MIFRRILAIGLILILVISGSGCDFFVETAVYREPERPTPILDPGHGGEDGGAVSITGQKESEINLAISQKIEQIFSLFGVETIVTRNSEEIIYPPEANTIRKRKAFDQHSRLNQINSVENGFLISIHQNTYPDGSPHGAEVLYNSSELAKTLAENLQRELISQLDPGNKRCSIRAQDSIYLMKEASCPAILVECGFLSHEEENKLLQESSYQLKLASLITGSFLKQ